MATNNGVNTTLSGQSGTGSFAGTTSPTFVTPTLGAATGTSLTLGTYSVLPVTAWVAYTPTFTGFGTVTGISVWSRRVGGNLEVRGIFTSGTATAVPAQITLGFNGTNSNVTSSNTVLASQNIVGSLALSTALSSMLVMQVQNNVGYMTYGLQDGSRAGSSIQNGNLAFANGTNGLFYASIPIDTWP